MTIAILFVCLLVNAFCYALFGVAKSEDEFMEQLYEREMQLREVTQQDDEKS